GAHRRLDASDASRRRCAPAPGALASVEFAQGSAYASTRLLPESDTYSVVPTMVSPFGLQSVAAPGWPPWLHAALVRSGCPSTPAASIPLLKDGRYSSAR